MKLKLLASATALACANGALAQQPVASTVAGNPALSTVYTLGDHKVLASAFNAVASFFNGGAMVGDSFMGQLLLLSALISLFFFVVVGVGKLKLSFSAWFLTLIFGLVIFMPKTTVYVTSYFGENGGTGIGPTPFEAVDNVPIGVAWPLGITSFVFKELTMRYDTWSTTPGGPADGGGFSEKGLEGYFSPLKTILRVQKITIPTEITKNLRSISKTCDGMDGRLNLMNVSGVEAVLNNPEGPPLSGLAKVQMRGTTGIKEMEVPCATAVRVIWAQMQAFVSPDSDGVSPLTRVIVTNSGMGEAMGVGSTPMNRAKLLQSEIDGVIAKLVDASEQVAQPYTTKTQSYIQTVFETSTDEAQLARAFENRTAVSQANVMANAVFNRVMAACAPNSGSDCTQSVYSIGEAVNRGSMNAAGEAGVFSAFMSHAANALMYIYVILSPIIMMVGVVMGVAGLKIFGAYLLFAAWINSWLPTAGAISAYMLHNYTNQIERIAAASKANLVASGYYTIPNMLLPSGLNDFVYSTNNMLGTASTLLSSVPLITLAIISGSIYGLVSVAQRMNMPDNFNEDRLAPPLDKSLAIGSQNDVSALGKEHAISEAAQAATTNAAAMSAQTIDFKYSSAETQEVGTKLSEAVSASKEHAVQHLDALAKANGSSLTNLSGSMATFRYGDGTQSTYNLSDQSDISRMTQDMQKLGSSATGNIGFGGQGGKGAIKGGFAQGLDQQNTAQQGRTESKTLGSGNNESGGSHTGWDVAKTSGFQRQDMSSTIRTITDSTSDVGRYLTAVGNQKEFNHRQSIGEGMDAKIPLNGADAQRVVAKAFHDGNVTPVINAANSVSPDLAVKLRGAHDAPSMTQMLFAAQTAPVNAAEKAAASAALGQVAAQAQSYEPSRSGYWSTVQKAAEQNAAMHGLTSGMESLANRTPHESALSSATKGAGLTPQTVNMTNPEASVSTRPSGSGSGFSGTGASGSGRAQPAPSHSSPNGAANPIAEGQAAVEASRTNQITNHLSKQSQRSLETQQPLTPPPNIQVGEPGGVLERATDAAGKQIRGKLQSAADNFLSDIKPRGR